MEMIKTFLIGIVLGVANIIPGVSGGTLAVIFKVYDKFIGIFNLSTWKKNWKFNLFIILGLGSGIILFSKLISFLFEKFPFQLNYLFTGIILGSIPMIYGFMIKNKTEQIKALKDANALNDLNDNVAVRKNKIAIPSVSTFIAMIFGLAVIIALGILEKKIDSSSDAIDVKVNFILCIKLFFSGFVAAVAMLVPGISGSFILVALGSYAIIISAISNLFSSSNIVNSLLILFPAGLGVLAGLFAGAKLISLLLEKKEDQTYGAIFGLVLGSVFFVFPGFKILSASVLICLSCILCFIAGFCLSFFCSRVKSKDNHQDKNQDKNLDK